MLAYNYSYQIVFDDPAAAYPALSRASELAKAGLAELPEDALALTLAFADYAQGNRTATGARKLRRVLKERDAAGAPATQDSARIWLALAVDDITARRYKEAAESGDLASLAIAAALPDDIKAHAYALVISGVGHIMPRPRTAASVNAARVIFEKAVMLYPPQESILAFDETLANAYAWTVVSRSALLSIGKADAISEGADEDDKAFDHELIKDDYKCEVKWEDRKPPVYPRGALYKGYLGGVIVGYNIGDDGKPKDARILSEVPAAQFGAAAVKAMAAWKLKEDVAPECRNNRITKFVFYMDE